MRGEHTKGPWRVLDEHPDGVLDRCVMAGGYYVATVHDTASHDGCWDADAALIAAAPDMAAALQAIMPTGVDTANRNVPDSQVVPVDVTMGELRMMQAAISRALGQGGEE